MLALLYRFFIIVIGGLIIITSHPAKPDELSCVTTYAQAIGKDYKICLDKFEDPGIKNIVCYISHAVAGGIGGKLGIASDPSDFSISCNQIGPVIINDLSNSEEILIMKSSVLFKDMRVSRIYDKNTNILIYLLYNINKLNNAPDNSISTVLISK